MRRGELWTYLPVAPRAGQSTLRLIVSDDSINSTEQLPTVTGLHVVEEDPRSLLAPQLGEHGWAVVTMIERVMRRRLGERIAVLDEQTMEDVDNALRASLGL